MNIELRNSKKEITGYAIVSPEDYEHLNQFKWYKNNGYVIGNVNKKKWSIHRYIMIEISKNNLIPQNPIDHINNNPLDNRRDNLRIVTPSENARNKKKKSNCSSEYIGVTQYKNRKMYKVAIRINGMHYSAQYKNEQHAAHQYNLWIDEYNIKNANKNNIEIQYDFIKYEKKNKTYPIGISKTKSGNFTVRHNFNNKDTHAGTYSNLEEAIEVRNNIENEYKKQNESDLLNTPILYNKNDQCILKINKIEIIIDKETYHNIIKYKWKINEKRKSIFSAFNNKMVYLSRYIMNYNGQNFIDHINNNILDNRKCNLHP